MNKSQVIKSFKDRFGPSASLMAWHEYVRGLRTSGAITKPTYDSLQRMNLMELASLNRTGGRRMNRAGVTRDYNYIVFPSTRVEGEGSKIPGHGKAALREAVRYAKSLGHWGAGVYDVSRGAFAGWITPSGRYHPFTYSGRVS